MNLQNEYIDKYGPWDGVCIYEHLKDTYYNSDQYEYSDNLRIANIGNKSEVEEYNRKFDDGCCGYYDTELDVPSGKTYKIGFNYGH